MHELPLVIFTVLAQTGVGAFVLLLIANKLSHITDRQLAIGLFTSMCLFGIGMFASMAHLGQVFRAFNTLSGIGRSPMSNEIIFAAIFAATGGLSSLLMLLNKGPRAFLHLFALIGAIAGLVFMGAVSMVYRIDTVASWANHYTTINMLLTILVCGGAFAALMGAVRIGSFASAVAIIISFALKPGYFATIWPVNSTLVAEQTGWFTAQFALLATGLMLTSLICSKRCDSKLPLFGCVAVLILAEMLGRVAFYNLWFIPM